jgi:hypothetical protein
LNAEDRWREIVAGWVDSVNSYRPFVVGIAWIVLAGCGGRREASIEFTTLPPAGEGSATRLEAIEGRVKGARPGEQIVLYARSGPWWAQPFRSRPYTQIQRDSTWKNQTHPGTAYAALLVKPGFRPPVTLDALPDTGGAVVAVASAAGAQLARAPIRTIEFSGYDWQVRQSASDPGGTHNDYDPANAWTDANGFLHLRIHGTPGRWTSAEVALTRSLGYGSYRFVVRDVSQLEPGAVFSMVTWDDQGPAREMDIELSRWGELTSKNAQFVVQPYHVPANTVRFMTPAGRVTYVLTWDTGRADFRALRGPATAGTADVIAEHLFTSGIPAPGNESVHMNLYVFGNPSNPLRGGAEVVVERFEYLP